MAWYTFINEIVLRRYCRTYLIITTGIQRISAPLTPLKATVQARCLHRIPKYTQNAIVVAFQARAMGFGDEGSGNASCALFRYT